MAENLQIALLEIEIQKIRNHALEEAAKVADNKTKGYLRQFTVVAEAIRALKEAV